MEAHVLNVNVCEWLTVKLSKFNKAVFHSQLSLTPSLSNTDNWSETLGVRYQRTKGPFSSGMNPRGANNSSSLNGHWRLDPDTSQSP